MENVSHKPLTRSPLSLSIINSNWFVIVMGFGGVLNVSAQLFSLTGSTGQWICGGVWINTGIFAFLLAVWLIRWVISPAKMWQELMHPVMGHFFALIPIAMAIMGMNWSLMGKEVSRDSVMIKQLPISSFAIFLGVALWGLAGWSFLLGFVMAFRVWIQKKLPFTLSWWAFVFPVSAYVLDSRTIAAALHTTWLTTYGDAFSVLLYLFFAIVLVNTVVALLTGRLFRQG
ncbi:hypothetical protein [Sulfobacillus thermosulfidooxidans]|uniref:SLAC1 family transporter n=1 Tax=Sulfobacillus thermosulfidooxidans TaxID=28034 RepID=UPI00096B724A|nr:hypothetical protein [Sulfobacillus thermosulfidooxidans]OLZ11076.1 hypothetical protein BFX05_08590 [Sulfobacillus thermosulfidooxidans]OLZ13495.1 hypothetical protein BFX06_10020 [Sulfobacillus thermosulfidooxidans]OLZ20760.1 hypothetical protein BFX07_14445 [Sulfobacillus thermosulfidooxidans]